MIIVYIVSFIILAIIYLWHSKTTEKHINKLTEYIHTINIRNHKTKSVFGNSSTEESILRISESLKNSIVNKYISEKDYKNKREYDEIINNKVDKLLEIHGMNFNNFDVISNIENFIEAEYKLSDNSVDVNSNKHEIVMNAVMSEATKSFNKVIGFRYLYRTMKELYGLQEAQRLSGELYDFSLGLMDSTQIMIPYCFALDTSFIMSTGRPFGQLKSKPAKYVSSYISVLNEVVHEFSNHIAGAIGLGTFFLDIAAIAMLKEKISLDDIKNNKEKRKYIENCFQQNIHSLNSLARSGSESPFTNISIFSPKKLRALLSDHNRQIYFVDNEGNNLFETNPNAMDIVIEYIIELEKIFMDFIDKGDPLTNGSQYRFPITTINLAKIEKVQTEDGSFKWFDGSTYLNDVKEVELNIDGVSTITINSDTDKYGIDPEDIDFLLHIITRKIKRYNILISLGMKVATCCRLVTNTEIINDYSNQVNSFGGSAISYGSDRVCTISLNRIALESSNEEEYMNILNSRISDTVKILVAHRELIKYLGKRNMHKFMSLHIINMQKLFSTIGIIGVWEAAKTMSEKKYKRILSDLEFKEYRRKFISEVLIRINDEANKLAKQYNIPINIEQVPGESMAVKLCKADKILFGEDKVPHVLYSNQFIPLWENVSIWERLEEDGYYNKLLSGGGIVHCNTSAEVTKSQALELITYSTKVGCEHFAINDVDSECENHHFTTGIFNECPICGCKIIEYYTRVVGFRTPVSAWIPERKNWEFMRRVFNKL